MLVQGGGWCNWDWCSWGGLVQLGELVQLGGLVQLGLVQWGALVQLGGTSAMGGLVQWGDWCSWDWCNGATGAVGGD